MSHDESLIRDFTHLVIPAEIWLRRDLSIQSKALWAEIRSLHSKSKGGCFASDEYLMEFMQLRRSRFFEILKELKDAELVEQVGTWNDRIIRKAHLPKQELEEVAESRPDCQSGKPDFSIRDPGLENPENRTATYIYNKEDRKAKEVAQSATPLRSNADSLSFSHEIGEFTGIGQKEIEDWKAIYPQLDIKRELLAMKEWLLSNKSKSNKKQWRKFITGWLQRNNEKAENKAAWNSQKGGMVDRRTKNQDGTPIKPVYDNLF